MGLVKRVLFWPAAISGGGGIAFIAAFLLASKSNDLFLFSALVAAGFSAASLGVGVIVYWLESIWRILPAMPRIASAKPEPGPEPIVALAKQFEERQEVLKERLNIDEQRFCTKANAPCTAWSFCGSVPKTPSAQFVESPEGQETLCSYEAERQSLPVIEVGQISGPCLAIQPEPENRGKPPLVKAGGIDRTCTNSVAPDPESIA